MKKIGGYKKNRKKDDDDESANSEVERLIATLKQKKTGFKS